MKGIEYYKSGKDVGDSHNNPIVSIPADDPWCVAILTLLELREIADELEKRILNNGPWNQE